MPVDIIQIQYERLAGVANQFARNAETTASVQQQLVRSSQALRHGGWEGRGAMAFFAELDGIVIPALHRLNAALGQSSATTRQISAIVQAAEAEAAAPFRDRERLSEPDSGPANEGALVGGEISASGGGTSASFIGGVIGDLKKTFKVEGKGPFIDLGKKVAGFKPELGVDLFSDSLRGEQFLGDYGRWDIGSGILGVGAKQIDGKWLAGVVGEFSTGRAILEGTLVGDQKLGWTAGVETKALSAIGFLGYYDGSVGGELGLNLVSVKGETGANIAGANVGVTAEIGAKWEWGFRIGKDTTAKLGIISLGISLGRAKPWRPKEK